MTRLLKYQPIGRYTYRILIDCPINLEYIVQLWTPILPIGANHLLQYLFNFPIQNLRLTIRLGVIRTKYLMSHSIFTKYSRHHFIAKVFFSMTYYNSWYPKMNKNMWLNEIYNHFRIISSGGFYFYLLGHIIYGQQDVKETKRRRKWTHKINTPCIKNFTKNHKGF